VKSNLRSEGRSHLQLSSIVVVGYAGKQKGKPHSTASIAVTYHRFSYAHNGRAACVPTNDVSATPPCAI